jgi:hypothetical protein
VTSDAVTARVMGFDPRKLRSVVQPERITTHPLGPWHPGAVRVIPSWGGALNEAYRAAITPELHIFSWRGQVEADDFDPPEVQSVVWDPETDQLRVQVQDRAGVASVRVAYEYKGRSYVQVLELMGGDVLAGEWRVRFPLGGEVRTASLTLIDELYNEQSLAMTW